MSDERALLTKRNRADVRPAPVVRTLVFTGAVACIASIVTAEVVLVSAPTPAASIAFASTTSAAFATCGQWRQLDVHTKLATAAEMLVSIRHAVGEVRPTDNRAPKSSRTELLATALNDRCAAEADPTRLVAGFVPGIYASDAALHPTGLA